MFHVQDDKIEYEPHYTLSGFMEKLDRLALYSSNLNLKTVRDRVEGVGLIALDQS